MTLRKINDPAMSPISTLLSPRTTNFFLSRLIPISSSKNDYKRRYDRFETPPPNFSEVGIHRDLCDISNESSTLPPGGLPSHFFPKIREVTKFYVWTEVPNFSKTKFTIFQMHLTACICMSKFRQWYILIAMVLVNTQQFRL